MRIGRLVTRSVIGGLFIGHGTQKLFGWFGGPGLDGVERMMGKLELHPPRRNAMAAGATEAVSGALLVAGAATPLAAAGLIGTMITAIRTVHLPNGPWVTNGGYEYNLVLIAALLGLVDGGAGELSVDKRLGIDRTDYRWALGALALGAATSAVVVRAGRSQAAAVHPDEPAVISTGDSTEPVAPAAASA